MNWRKCVAVAAVGAMLAVPVAAEAPGVHDLTDDELKALYMDVKQELMDRGIWEGTTLPAGVYVGGEDLPEGTYICTNNSLGWVKCYQSFDAYRNDEKAISAGIISKGEQFTIKLTDGLCWTLQVSATGRPMMSGLDW